MSQLKIQRVRLMFPLLLALLIAACGAEADAGGAGGDSLSLGISSPQDGAEVGEAFTVEFDAPVPLGDPSTGNHHVHLCVDSEDCSSETEYTLVYETTFEVTGLTPGEHAISASLRNADHSDAGPGDEIMVTVGEGETTDGETDDGGAPDDGAPDDGATDGVTDTTTAPGFDYDY